MSRKEVPVLTGETRKRFETYIDRSAEYGGCWRWTGTPNRYGYGLFAVNRRSYPAHRLSYVLDKGPFDWSLNVLHKCPGGGNPWCVNPEHLQLGTQAENIQDAKDNGRLVALCGENHPNTKLTWDIVHQIRKEARGKLSAKELGKKYGGLSNVQILNIIRGKSWLCGCCSYPTEDELLVWFQRSVAGGKRRGIEQKYGVPIETPVDPTLVVQREDCADWTTEEEERLIGLVLSGLPTRSKKGEKCVQTHLPGRTDNAISARISKLRREGRLLKGREFRPLPVLTERQVANFWKKVSGASAGTDRCWEWQKSSRRNGYGLFGVYHEGRVQTYPAHRLAYYLHYGVDPGDLEVMHMCPTGENRACCNPGHLTAGSKSQNQKMAKEGGKGVHRVVFSQDQLDAWESEFKNGESLLGLATRYNVSYERMLKLGKNWVRSDEAEARARVRCSQRAAATYASGVVDRE